jgi:hypothetical protein
MNSLLFADVIRPRRSLRANTFAISKCHIAGTEAA